MFSHEYLTSHLLPGDTLIYRPKGFFGHLIAIKTWNKHASHVEVYLGNGESFASRDGIGVNVYKLRTHGLSYILRPVPRLNWDRAWIWIDSVKGQKYDWKGILVFTLAVGEGSYEKQFCSEAWTRFYRAAGVEPFSTYRDGNPLVDADTVAPSTCLYSAQFEVLWSPYVDLPNWS